MEIICLDSSVLIDHFRQSNKNNTFFFKLAGFYQFSIASIVWYEITRGNSRSQIFFWNNLLNNIDILPFDKDCADIAANLYQQLKKINKLAGTDDLLIAATALRYGYKVVTLNQKHFQNIPNLDLITINDI
jgi:tRNA(fMet)-specific endonuclease VapC